jgi:hypothetical protein
MAEPRPLIWLGTHKPAWLWGGHVDFPLCVSLRSLKDRKILRPAVVDWVLDSGAFTELATAPEGERARWRMDVREFVGHVARLHAGIGRMAWAATMDMMCEPAMIHGGRVGMVTVPGTGRSVAEHQWLSLGNFIGCCELWPEYSDAPCPFIPPLQGWTMGDYLWHQQMYVSAGIDLASYPAVGLGSVCRRQGGPRPGLIAQALGLSNLHGYGVSMTGLELARHTYGGTRFASIDTMAWSYDAYRAGKPLPGHTHRTCANCPEFAGRWRARMMRLLAGEDPGPPLLPTGRAARREARA